MLLEAQYGGELVDTCRQCREEGSGDGEVRLYCQSARYEISSLFLCFFLTVYILDIGDFFFFFSLALLFFLFIFSLLVISVIIIISFSFRVIVGSVGYKGREYQWEDLRGENEAEEEEEEDGAMICGC